MLIILLEFKLPIKNPYFTWPKEQKLVVGLAVNELTMQSISDEKGT